jgi:hypothetical protein
VSENHISLAAPLLGADGAQRLRGELASFCGEVGVPGKTVARLAAALGRP